ncbi:MAG: hypothetical protein KAT06_12765, partial [Gammaproteobacteria bacterium]|nr:hypothetical protein [Gammaproteobacteria bacterium]
VNTLWTAKRIYNFINAYKKNNVPFLCEVAGKQFSLIDAYTYQNTPYSNMNGEQVVMEGDKITFSCKNSYIQCQLKESD